MKFEESSDFILIGLLLACPEHLQDPLLTSIMLLTILFSSWVREKRHVFDQRQLPEITAEEDYINPTE